MVAILEQRMCQSLKAALADLEIESPIPESTASKAFLSDLEWFAVQTLAELYERWRYEGYFDGIYSVRLQKIADCEIEFFGACCWDVIKQTLAPLHVRLQLAESLDEVSWCEIRLGEVGKEHVTYREHGRLMSRLRHIIGSIHEIDWIYKVTYGERRA